MDKIGEIIVSLSGEKVEFEEISKQLNAEASKIVRQGTKITQSFIAPSDKWMLITEIASIDEMGNQLLDVLTQLNSVNENLTSLKNGGLSVSCDIYLRPQSEQYGFSLSIKAINILSNLNLEINYHVISYYE